MIEEGRNQAKTSLAGDFTAVIENGSLRILPNASLTGAAFSAPFSLGETQVKGSGAVIRVEMLEENRKIHSLSTGSYIILDRSFVIMKDGLHWRSRREGDVLVKGGMTRRLRKLYNQKKIPLRLRERLPLLCDEKGILWAPYLGLRDGVTASEKGILISLEMGDELL